MYVVKGTIMGRPGQIAFRPNEIIRNTKQWTARGLKAELIPEMIKSGFLSPCTLETLPAAAAARTMKAPQAIADNSVMGKDGLKAIDNPDQDRPYDNDSSVVLGYDKPFLDSKNERELQDIVMQAIPGISEAQARKMGRAQMEDILSKSKGTGQTHVPHTVGGSVVPKT